MAARLEPTDGEAPPPPATLQDACVEIERLRDEVARLAARLAEAERAADLDSLVPVLNHRAFVRAVAQRLAYITRYGGEGAVVFFDLDRFKAVNDVHGHAAGDCALLAVGGILAAQVRETDAVGRMGGDEFAVLLSHVTQAEATAKAESLSTVIASHKVDYGDAEIALSASWGVYGLQAGRGAAEILAYADAAMYQAKVAQRV